MAAARSNAPSRPRPRTNPRELINPTPAPLHSNSGPAMRHSPPAHWHTVNYLLSLSLSLSLSIYIYITYYNYNYKYTSCWQKKKAPSSRLAHGTEARGHQKYGASACLDPCGQQDGSPTPIQSQLRNFSSNHIYKIAFSSFPFIPIQS